MAVSSPPSTYRVISALHSHTRPGGSQKDWARAKHLVLPDLVSKAALSCHTGCQSLPQWPPRPPSHGWESRGRAAQPPVALAGQEPSSTNVPVDRICLQPNCPPPAEAEAPEEHWEAPQQLSNAPLCISNQTPLCRRHNRSQSPGHSLHMRQGLVSRGHKHCCLALSGFGFEPNLAVINHNVMVHHGHCA